MLMNTQSKKFQTFHFPLSSHQHSKRSAKRNFKNRLVKLHGDVSFTANNIPESTMYIKGFLSPSSKPEHFQRWISSHEVMLINHGWGPLVYGWYTGLGEGEFQKLNVMPASIATGVVTMIRLGSKKVPNPWIFGASIAVDAAWTMSRLYNHVVKNMDTHAMDLAQCIQKEHKGKLRIVAHSLGCKLLYKALLLIPKEERPHEIHLCAPAVTEDEIITHLSDLATENVFLYYSKRDVTLEYGFHFMEFKEAIGYAGLSTSHPKVHCINIDSFVMDAAFVHSTYDENFHYFAGLKQHKLD
jgi:hypothetical protein